MHYTEIWLRLNHENFFNGSFHNSIPFGLIGTASAVPALHRLSLPIFNLVGTIYLFSALILGGFLLYAAWQVFRVGDNKVAWTMYRWSSMYLAFIFLALMIDAVV